MAKLNELVEKHFKEVFQKGNFTAVVYNSSDAKIVPESRATLSYEKSKNSDESRVVLSDAKSNQRCHSMTIKNVKTIAKAMDDAYMTTKYRNVLKIDEWCTMFQAARRSVDHVIGTTLKSSQVDT